MARQGLAALTGGYMEGKEFRDKRDREKQVRELLGRENVRLANISTAKKSDVERMRPGEFDFAELEEPENWLQKTGKWLRNLGGGGQQQAVPMQALQAPPDQGYAARTAEPPVFKHGGSVRQMRKKYSNGGRSLTPMQGYKDGGKAIADDEDGFGDDLKRNALELVQGGFARTWSEAKEMSREVGKAGSEMIAPGRTPAQRGKSAREALYQTGRGLVETAGGLMEDTGLNAVGAGMAGFVGYGTGGENEGRDQAIPNDQPPEEVVPQGGAAAPTGAGGGAPVSAGGGQAPQAIPSTQGSGQEQEIDFSTQAREVMPEDLPSQTSKDWEDEQNYWAASAIMKGEDPFAAMDKVTKRQQDGFTRYAMQATTLMDAGDMEGAARALYAAYQYFPNGKDVKFGIQKGKDGQRVIVGMGKDEESGETSGPPQILNRDTVTRMVENLQKPGALRVWTNDWIAVEKSLLEMGFKKDQLKETGRHNRATERIDAYKAAATAAGGGMKQADLDRAFKVFREDVALKKLEGEEGAEVANDLADIMSRLYQKTGGGRAGDSDNAILKAVIAAYTDGSLDQLREKYGLQQQAVQ